ncbi:hypothetical protein HNQ93_001236 [Hymenobacter luteus]|uniref:Uncharacterized protein n=2 Tax=Hymenobacter TaxID=89966 RepID=A0A7W9SYV0_9BACT|nr:MULTISPECIES: hypothetical protein [Hymenobacter]MBB4601403.1 hypothetical protein [Hymenobacter latericoloratus]MBB6058390.1 hypothetical protein [Hymenobacter luteus]
MLTKRTSLLTVMGLLTSYLATAQTPAATGPQPTDILSWLAGALAVVVLLMGLMTGVSLATAAAQSDEQAAPAEAEAATSLTAVAAEPQPAAATPVLTAAPALTPEQVLAA